MRLTHHSRAEFDDVASESHWQYSLIARNLHHFSFNSTRLLPSKIHESCSSLNTPIARNIMCCGKHMLDYEYKDKAIIPKITETNKKCNLVTCSYIMKEK